MSFDWSEYLNVAIELASVANSSANKEGRLRSAISRAYYAAFINARNYLRDREGLLIPRTSDAHRYVSVRFDHSPDPMRQSLGEKLLRLREFRRQADYVDTFPGLFGITQTALKLSEQVISTLHSLEFKPIHLSLNIHL